MKVKYAGDVLGKEEKKAMRDAIRKGWWVGGNYTNMFEDNFARFFGMKDAVFCNSGSSANLLAVKSLRIPKKSEIITPAVTFPTTLNPIIQCGHKPVLVDIDLDTYNIEISKIEEQITDKTAAIMLPHTLGIPNNMDKIMKICNRNGLLLIEDCCDALGSKWGNKLVGTFGKVATFSFYPAHHITTLGGGMCISDDGLYIDTMRSLRDWGRMCVCKPCTLNTIGKCKYGRFNSEYDRRFTYINIGYNLQATEIQAAVGIEQLKKVKRFEKIRKRNYDIFRGYFETYWKDVFALPKLDKKADPSWFAFPLRVTSSKFTRNDIMKYLVDNGVGCRPIFMGNALKHPAYKNVKIRHGDLVNSDIIYKDAFFIGVYQGLTKKDIDYVINVFNSFWNKIFGG